MSTTIEWTNETWNPTSGCERVSPGCDNCYALRFAERFRGAKGHYFEHGFDVMLRAKMLARPDGWPGHKFVFVNSMSDLFHRLIPDEYIDRVFEVMERVDRHVYQVLTKRPERMRRYIKRRYGTRTVPQHIWLGVSVENADYAWRATMLGEIKAKVRFLSVEPMLGPVEHVDLTGIDWVIVGGESGAGRRQMDAAWVRDVRDRCLAAGVPFFFKQWHKAGTGRELDGVTWDQMPPANWREATVETKGRRRSRLGALATAS